MSRFLREPGSFRASIKSGREDADARMAQSLFHRGIGYSHKAEKIAFDKEGNVLLREYVEHYPPDTASMIFWLKNRRRTSGRRATVGGGEQ